MTSYCFEDHDIRDILPKETFQTVIVDKRPEIQKNMMNFSEKFMKTKIFNSLLELKDNSYHARTFSIVSGSMKQFKSQNGYLHIECSSDDLAKEEFYVFNLSKPNGYREKRI